MVEIRDYAFILMLIGVILLTALIAYCCGHEQGEIDARKTKARLWHVVEIPRDAQRVRFILRHQGSIYDSSTSHEVTTAPIDNEEELGAARALAEARCQDFNARGLKPS